MFKVNFYLNVVTANSEEMSQEKLVRNYEGIDNVGQLANHIETELHENTFLMDQSGKRFFRTSAVTDFFIEEIKEGK